MPPKKKKMTKKEKARMAALLAEQQRQEEEMRKQQIIQEAKDSMEQEKKDAEEKAKNDLIEHSIREGQLNETLTAFQSYQEPMRNMLIENRYQEEWKQYLTCDGLPNPASVSEMNTYLYMWKMDESTNEIEAAVKKTKEVLELLNVLEELIDVPLDKTPRQIENWKELRNNFRVEQQQHLDAATYKLLRELEKQMEIIGLNEAHYKKENPYFIMCIQALLPLPKSSSMLEKPTKMKPCVFEDLGLSVEMPESLSIVNFALRALGLTYDHFSDRCPSWDPKPLPPELTQDLNAVTKVQWEEQIKLQAKVDAEVESRNKDKRKIILKATTQISQSAVVLPQKKKKKENAPPPPDYAQQLLEMQLLPPVKTASELFCLSEDDFEEEMHNYLLYECEPFELNLHKFTILGGVLHLDLLEQLPQPHVLDEKRTVTVLNTPQVLEPVKFYVPYTSPPPPEPGQRRLPEEIEIEMKIQEELLDKLPSVNITLSETVLWFEPPTVARWDSEKGYWSTADCHDFKFNEDKQVLTFRLSRFGPLGLSVYKYSNLPYQTWELKPDIRPGCVTLSITAAIIIVEFTIKDDTVRLSQLQNGATMALQDIVGIDYEPHILIKKMCRGGVNLFPEHDALCYVEGCCPKHRSTENHLYHCMAMLSTTYNFSWSRWNSQAGRRTMVMQMREYLDSKHVNNYNMLYVTPLRTSLVDCTEMSPGLNPQGLPNMKFYADVYHLVQEHSSIIARKKMTELSFTTAETVYEMLKRTQVLSFA